MTPSRPYLLRALYNWILDNNMTPHVVIDANYKGVVVPREHVENGQIILSIAPQSIYGMEMNNDYLSFAARFAGVSRDIYLPILSVTAIYSEENRKGMVFAEEKQEESEYQGAENKLDKSNLKTKGRPNLKIVSSNTNTNNTKDEDDQNK